MTYEELRQKVNPNKVKPRRLTKLSIKEVKEVFQAVKEDKLTHASTAIKFSISANTVGHIVRSFKVKADYVGELLERQNKKEEKLMAAIRTI